MNRQEHPAALLLDLLVLACEKRALKKATLSKPSDGAVLRTVLTPRVIGGEPMLQAESFMKDNKALHKNIPERDLEALALLLSSYGQINLMTTAGDCELRRSQNGKATLLRGEKLQRALGGEVEVLAVRGNDDRKQHILRGDEPFLRLLGISDKNGRVLDTKRSKFRQINRFLEEIRVILPHLPEEGPLVVADLCCGKSYLSFAVYHYLSIVLGRQVKMVGVDLKPDVIAYCAEVAELLSFDGLQFVCGDIVKYGAQELPSLVISLHACDVATDMVINKAIEWQAPVLLSTPCCHHELNHTISCEPLSFVTEYSMLRQKLCDAATDALRLKWLEAHGYGVDALELIDPEETPKNILLRAIRKPSPSKTAMQRAREEYERARSFLLGL